MSARPQDATDHAVPARTDAYRIDSVRKSDAPPGGEGAGWHRYVITQGNNTICGFRQGTLAFVTTEIEEIVVRLNERRAHKRGRTHVVLRSKKTRSAKVAPEENDDTD